MTDARRLRSRTARDICEWMISEKDERVPLSAYGRESQQQQALAKNINTIIQRITLGKSVFPRWSSSHGKVIDVNASTLYKGSLDELIAIDKEVAELRARRAGTREQQKETLHQFANQNRVGYDDKGNKIVGFENRPKTDSLDATPIRPYSGEDSKSAIAVRVEARHGETDRAANTTASNDPFISASGREYTKKEVYGIAAFC